MSPKSQPTKSENLKSIASLPSNIIVAASIHSQMRKNFFVIAARFAPIQHHRRRFDSLQKMQLPLITWIPTKRHCRNKAYHASTFSKRA
ncbi:unnamed protein product [Rhodiola kirilowii]